MSVLSLQDLKFWETHGYLVIRQAVPVANCEAAEDDLFCILHTLLSIR